MVTAVGALAGVTVAVVGTMAGVALAVMASAVAVVTAVIALAAVVVTVAASQGTPVVWRLFVPAGSAPGTARVGLLSTLAAVRAAPGTVAGPRGLAGAAV